MKVNNCIIIYNHYIIHLNKYSFKIIHVKQFLTINQNCIIIDTCRFCNHRIHIHKITEKSLIKFAFNNIIYTLVEMRENHDSKIQLRTCSCTKILDEKIQLE